MQTTKEDDFKGECSHPNFEIVFPGRLIHDYFTSIIHKIFVIELSTLGRATAGFNVNMQ